MKGGWGIGWIARVTISLGLLVGGAVHVGDRVYYYHNDPLGTPLAMTDSVVR